MRVSSKTEEGSNSVKSSRKFKHPRVKCCVCAESAACWLPSWPTDLRRHLYMRPCSVSPLAPPTVPPGVFAHLFPQRSGIEPKMWPQLACLEYLCFLEVHHGKMGTRRGPKPGFHPTHWDAAILGATPLGQRLCCSS